MIKKIIFCLLVLVPSLLFAQDVDEEAIRQKKMNQLMREQIFRLKDGVLLVRLQTRQNSIQALKQNHMPKAAARVELEQKEFNKEVLAAFKKNFSFCPVYFFYTPYSDTLLAKHFSSIVFLNDSLLPDTSIRPAIHKFLVAEFGNLQQDTAAYVAGSYIYHGDNGYERRIKYSGGNNPQISSLRIMSEELVQLRNPFPYFTRVIEVFSIEKKLSIAVISMNEKLQAYYESEK